MLQNLVEIYTSLSIYKHLAWFMRIYIWELPPHRTQKYRCHAGFGSRYFGINIILQCTGVQCLWQLTSLLKVFYFQCVLPLLLVLKTSVFFYVEPTGQELIYRLPCVSFPSLFDRVTRWPTKFTFMYSICCKFGWIVRLLLLLLILLKIVLHSEKKYMNSKYGKCNVQIWK